MVWTTNATNHISKQKMLQTSSHHMTATWSGSPEETQNEHKERLPSSCQLLQTRPTVHSGNSGWEDTGHWPQIAEVHLKGMTAVSPDFASSHTERTSLVAQMVKASAYNAGDLGFIPGLGRWPGEGNGSPLQYSCLENPTDRGDWQATVHGVIKSRTRLNDFTFTFIHRKGLISLTWDIWFSLIINNLLMFWLPALCCKNSQTSWLFKAVPQWSETSVSRAQSPEKVCLIKHSSHLYGCAFFSLHWQWAPLDLLKQQKAKKSGLWV